MPATLNAPLSHRIIRRLTRGLFRLIGLFQAQDNTREEGLPREIRVILKITAMVSAPELPPPPKMRRLYRLLTIPYHVSAPPMAEVSDHTVPDGPNIRLYRPEDATPPIPALVYFHGGGGVIGDLETHDPLCRYLAAKAGIVVVAVDYRLGPEHKYPAQIDDARAAFRWVRENAENLGIDAARIGAGGDSAGAYLSLLLGRQLKADGKIPDTPDYLWLIYPGINYDADSPSRRQFTEGLLLTSPVLDYFRSHVLGDKPAPSLVLDSSGTMPAYPPICLTTVGFDPLRDEAVNFARDARTAGIGITHLHYPRLLHEFISMAGVVPEARAALDEAIKALNLIIRA